jgi:hypothetical protein
MAVLYFTYFMPASPVLPCQVQRTVLFVVNITKVNLKVQRTALFQFDDLLFSLNRSACQPNSGWQAIVTLHLQQ